MAEDRNVPGYTPASEKEEPTHAETLDLTPRAEPNVMPKALAMGGLAALIGGAGKGLFGGGNILSDTLGGALQAGIPAASTTAYLLADPVQRGQGLGTAYEASVGKAIENLIAGKGLFSGMPGTALSGLLEGGRRFNPEVQKSLIQQYTQSELPSMKSWKETIRLAEKTSNQMMGRNPASAIGGLQKMVERMPDINTRTAAQHGLKLISQGITTPQHRIAVAALGRRIKNELGLYRQMTEMLPQLAEIKELYAKGQLTTEEAAGRIGLLKGLFGPKTEERERMRKFVLQVIARPVRGEGSMLARMAEEDPELAGRIHTLLT